MSRCTTRCACAWATARQDAQKQTDARGDVELTIVAVGVDVLAFDVLEDDIGLAGWRDAGVDQVGDRRMRQPREDRAFANEPFFSAAPNQRGVEELDRRRALESPVAAAGKPHAPHAARADTRDERVRTDDLTGERRGACSLRHRAGEESRAIEILVLGEQDPQVRGNRRFALRERGQPRIALAGRNLQHIVQVRAQGLPAFGIDDLHGVLLDRRRRSDRAVQIEPALLPAPFDRALRDAAQGRNLGDGEAAEELQLHDLGEGRIVCGELVERIADLGEPQAVRQFFRDIGVERREEKPSAPFLGVTRSCFIDDEAARLRGPRTP